MVRVFIFGVLFFLALSACSSSVNPPPPPALVKIYSSPAARPWLGSFHTCAGEQGLALQESLPDQAQIRLRAGEPLTLQGVAYQVGQDALYIAVHPQNRVGELSQAQLRSLFGGQLTRWKAVGGADVAVTLWVFPTGNDWMAVFDGIALGGVPAASTARLATGAEQMAQEIASAEGALGLLPQSFASPQVRLLQKVADFPILALLKDPADANMETLLGCAATKNAP